MGLEAMSKWRTKLTGTGDTASSALEHGEAGQDMIEYALLAALISIVAIGIILLVGPYLQNAFMDVVNAVNSA
jgi:Flp pilus assembly pilin Flp